MPCFVQSYASCFVKEIRSAQKKIHAFLIEDRGRPCSIKKWYFVYKQYIDILYYKINVQLS